MIRSRLSHVLILAGIKVAENQTPEYIKDQLKQKHKALALEVSEYRTALANFISPN